MLMEQGKYNQMTVLEKVLARPLPLLDNNVQNYLIELKHAWDAVKMTDISVEVRAAYQSQVDAKRTLAAETRVRFI